ncbi:hypothetical protein [Brachybacterium hainanense]|uniref:Uncharacterized protein n=1 Tax=Brachybacterium hainanense TaxID=1541174 RepID=A0ABV6RF73_9MICO
MGECVYNVSISLQGYAHITPERLAAIAAVFDKHDYLRPNAVREDGIEIPITTTLQSVIAGTPLPISWIMSEERKEGRLYWNFELPAEEWEVSGNPGRASMIRSRSILSLNFPAPPVDSDRSWNEIAWLLADLGESSGAAYGFSCLDSEYEDLDRWYPLTQSRPSVDFGLGTVFWVQYFGAAMARKYPELRSLKGSFALPSGAVLYRAAVRPSDPDGVNEGPLEAPWKAELVRVLNPDAFAIGFKPNPRMPTMEEFSLADSRGSEPLEELVSLVTHTSAQAMAEKEAAYVNAHAHRESLERRRRNVPKIQEFEEWSANMDSMFFDVFCNSLRDAVKPKVSKSYMESFISEAQTAPPGASYATCMDSQEGPFMLRWTAEDETEMIVEIYGSPELASLAGGLSY